MLLDRASQQHMRELLGASETARDALPYTPEFATLKEAFYDRTFKKMSDADFWQTMLSVAKKGGIRGKSRTKDPAGLSQEQLNALKSLLPVSIGETDRLPYTEKFDTLLARFNSNTSLQITHHQLWLAVLRLRK